MFTETQTTTTGTGEAGAPRKFMFERSFDASSGPRVPERKPVTLKPEQYDALRKEGYDEGFAAGRQAGLDDQAQRLMLLLNNVGGKIDAMLGQMQALRQESETGMRQMALAIARKFVPDFSTRHGVAEIEAMLSAIISEMMHEPRLVVRVHESQFDALDEKITQIAAQKAYTGKIVVMASNEIAAGDCLIEWSDGGMERNAAMLWDKIEQTVTP